MTAALTVILGGAAVAQPRQPAGGPARAASTNAAAAQAARQRISTAGVHLVSGAVRDTTGRALGGVCVLATAADGTMRMARTSASGRYVMSLPHAGAYSVRYGDCQPGKAAAFVPPPARPIVVGASPVTALPAATLRPVSVASDRTALPAAGVAVRREGRIIERRAGGGPAAHEAGASGSLAGGLTGRVTDPAGKPLAGICVWAISPTVDGTTTADGIETAANGTYDFGADQLGTGLFRVLFTSACAGFTDPFEPIAPGPWAPEWYKDAFTFAKADKVQLRANQVTRGINAVMRHTAKIGGVVTGSDGRLVRDACAVVLAGPVREVGQATTNSRGAYTVTGLDPGSYRVLVIPDCNGPSVYGNTYYPRAQTFSAAHAVTARLGHLTSGINVVVPKLGTISGVIRVGGKTGTPLAGICVDATSTTNFSLGGFAVSGRNGAYSVEGLPAGSYQVDASVGCGNNGNYAPATYPRPVRVVNGKVAAGINLYPQPGGTVTGTVTDAATGKPVGGICVVVSLGFGLGAATNAAGTYTIDQLPAGRTTVAFSGGCGNKGSYAPQFYNDQVTQEAAAQLSVTAGHVTGGIDAAMLPGATVAGRVTNSAGRPVSAVCVGLVPADLSGINFIVGGNTSTIVSGSYVVANLAPGDYGVAFFSGCNGPSNAAVLQWFKGQPSAQTAGMVDARAGSRLTGIDAVVSPGGAIAGTVTTTTGQPVEFDCVTAINRRTGQPAGFQSVTGDAFTVSSLPPGSYTVVAGDCAAGDNLAQSVYPVPVTVRAGLTTGNVTLKLPTGGSVTGRVIAAGSGRPVPGACVEATPVSATAASLGINGGALTGRSGTYRIAGLRTGSYRITIFPNCFGDTVNLRMVTLPHSVSVTQGKVTANVNAALLAGGSIAGQVTDPGAAAVPGACVEAFQIPGGLAASALTDANGNYTITGLAPGKYTVEFGDPLCSDGAAGLGIQWYNGAASSGSATVITVTAGQTASGVSAVLPADGTITGTVTGKSAAKLSGVCVSAVPVATAEPAIFTVSSGGSYTLDGLLPGRYRVEFQAGCGQAGVTTQWWQDASSSAAAQIVTVSPGATLSGIDAVMTGA
jgi:hypothetical protein